MPPHPLSVAVAALVIGAVVGYGIGRFASLWWFVLIWIGMTVVMIVIWWNNLQANQGIPGILGILFLLYVMLPGFVSSTVTLILGRRRRADALASSDDPG